MLHLLGNEDITTEYINDKGHRLRVDWLDFGVAIITCNSGTGCDVLGSFSWKRDSAEHMGAVIMSAFGEIEGREAGR